MRLAVRDIAFFERPVAFVRPFRFGAVVINAAPQMFVRVEIEVEGKGASIGASAEMLVPKWFDKRAHVNPDETVTELRRSLLIDRELHSRVTAERFEQIIAAVSGDAEPGRSSATAAGGRSRRVRPLQSRLGEPRMRSIGANSARCASAREHGRSSGDAARST